MTQAARQPERITPEELKSMMDRGEPVTILDVRSPHSYDDSDVKIKGAMRIPPGQVVGRTNEIPRDKEIVTYWTWPEENTSARVAQILVRRGFPKVRPVLGGFDAWVEKGYPVEPK